MIMSTLTLYHEIVLHITKLQIGSIQAFATLSMYITKFICGITVDILHNHKTVLLIGSILSMVTRPLFAFAYSLPSIFILSSTERLTKGFRSGPTDALISITAPPEQVGEAIALKQVAYSAGSCFGCIVAALFLLFSNNNFTLIYKYSIIPGIVATVLLFLVKPKYKENIDENKRLKQTFKWEDIKKLPPILIIVYLLVYAVTTARFGENFIGHRFYEFGMPVVYLPLVYVLFNLPFALTSYYVSKIYDSMNWKKIFLYGLGFLTLSNLFLMSSEIVYGLILGTIFGGIQMGITQGLFLTVISKYTPTQIRGTAYAIYHIMFGLGLFSSFYLTGYLAHTFNTWKAGFLGQAIISVILMAIVSIFLPSTKFFQRKEL